jgi:hypothetical protein
LDINPEMLQDLEENVKSAHQGLMTEVFDEILGQHFARGSFKFRDGFTHSDCMYTSDVRSLV